MFQNIYSGKKILVTGHTGTKGSWLSFWLHRMGAQVYGISHSPKPGPNHYELLNLHGVLVKDIHADISLVEEITSIQPDLVMHLAARAIVSRAFLEPEYTMKCTVMGMVHLLELCRCCPSIKGIVAIETDKVYDNQEWDWGYREMDELGGDDPYSMSKVCVDQVIRCYRKSYGMNISATRSGNIIAGGDWNEKRLIPDIVKATAKGESVEIHTPNATRPWLHILDTLRGYLLLGQKILQGEDVNSAFNFGPNDEMTVLDVLEKAKSVWPNVQYVVKEQETHKHMVQLLKIDSTKSNKLLGWKPLWTTEEAIARTIEWYRAYFQEGEVLTDKQIEEYEGKE